MVAAHELPGLPPLLPMELPAQKDTNPNPSPGSITVSNPPHFLQSPTLSVAEPFSTAFTGDKSEEASRFGFSSPAPPQSLRKSVSVDSFAQYKRDGSRKQSNRFPGPSHPSVYDIVESQRRSDAQVWPRRHRNESLAFRHPPDSDTDRYDPTGQPGKERPRHLSMKSQDPTKTSIPPGELSLPSRTQSTSAVASPLGYGSHEYPPSILSSLQISSRRSSAFATPAVGRVRSGSLGYNPSKRMITNPHIPFAVRSPSSKEDIALLVIGATGCGKSTVVNKGLSEYGLTKATISESTRFPACSRYIRRTGYLKTPSPGGSFPVLDVIEVEIQTTSSGSIIWPQGLPAIDGVAICYDSSRVSSYQLIERVINNYRSTNLPIVVLGCKADLPHEVDPRAAVDMLTRYHTQLIEVSSSDPGRMAKSFDDLFNAISFERGPNRIIDDRNPATEEVSELPNHPPTSLPIMPSPFGVPSLNANSHTPHTSDALDIAQSLDFGSPTSLPRTKATGDLLQENELPKPPGEVVVSTDSDDAHRHNDPEHSLGLPKESPSLLAETKKNETKKEPRPAQWADLDDLLDKLLFLSVSRDDPTFTIHFLLTYRRFATPRSVLLAMQKRMRQLDNPCGDPMFACFAQMRICHLLETWIRDYPHDFSVKGAAGALHALIKSIISKTHLLHYGSEFLAFLEQLPGLKDQDSAWALKGDISGDSDDDTPEDEDDEASHTTKSPAGSISTTSSDLHQVEFPSRERKSSLPLRSPSPQLNGTHPQPYDQPPKQHIKDLVKLAQGVLNTDSDEIAQEITRQGVHYFLKIKPRDWLHYTFGKKDSESITTFNTMSNLLADWVVSLILCHERPRNRARQIEKFVEIAQRLRLMNNYSALRAFVAGINNATDDPTMEEFKTRSPEHAKNLKSWDVLLQQIRSHRAYRMALRNSRGACIPALEVHMSDLIRAHEGNGDSNDAYPSKIHWAKFNMMGRFIASTLQCQAQCRNSDDYDFVNRRPIAELFIKVPVMSTEMQKSRLKSQDFDFDYVHPPPFPSPSRPKDITGLRNLFLW